MRSADSGLEHSAAPHRNGMRPADLLYAFRFAVTANAPELDVNNSAGLQLDGRKRMSRIIDAFIQANRGLNLGLQFRVRVNVVPVQRVRRS